MIHLDTNYLIQGLSEGTSANLAVTGWLAAKMPLATSAVAWMEFMTGPVHPAAVDMMRFTVQGRIITFSETDSILAAELFNSMGRRRALRYDCMIAACAINADARLATFNITDFSLFIPHGLKLAT